MSMHFIKKFLVDIFLIAGLTFGIYATVWIWVPFERGFFCGDESLMFPYKPDTVTTPMLRLLSLLLPITAFLVCEFVLLRKEVDDKRIFNMCIPVWARSFYCSLASFSYGCCFIELAINATKNVIGRLRPHFFDLCKPSIDCSLPEWQKRYIQPNEYHCLGDQTDKFHDMHMSFLSGHSAWSAYAMLYLALYLEKRMVWRGARGLRHSLQFAAMLLSWFIAMSRVSDYKHHWSDVLAGYSLGLTFAILVWKWGTDILEPKSKHKPIPLHDSSHMEQRQTALPA
ncbi:unnamed protein product, partial [Brenthis ino]